MFLGVLPASRPDGGHKWRKAGSGEWRWVRAPKKFSANETKQGELGEWTSLGEGVKNCTHGVVKSVRNPSIKGLVINRR
jgi:hypothetical protein